MKVMCVLLMKYDIINNDINISNININVVMKMIMININDNNINIISNENIIND